MLDGDAEAEPLHFVQVGDIFEPVSYTHLDVYKRQGYGWCEYIEPGEVSSAAEVGRFYRRFGSACALMQALGGSDLHSSNWICSGGLPVLVDVETALSPVPRVFSDKRMFPELMSESESFLSDANRSLIPSSLLPSRLAGRELSVLLDDSDSSGCEPVLGGKRRSVLGFEAEFLSGFSEGYDRCMARRDELLRSLEGFSGVTVRRLLREMCIRDRHRPLALPPDRPGAGSPRPLRRAAAGRHRAPGGAALRGLLAARVTPYHAPREWQGIRQRYWTDVYKRQELYFAAAAAKLCEAFYTD